MAAFRPFAQEVIKCEFCERSVQQFCNSCQVKLCAVCVIEHVNENQSRSHAIVHFSKRKTQLVFTDCEDHDDQLCQGLCQQCHIPVCARCLLGRHKHHNAYDIEEVVKIKKKEIQRQTHKIENEIIPHYKKINSQLTNDLSRITAEINEIEKKMKTLRSIWHQEVDYLFDKLGSLFAEAKNRNSETLKKKQIKLNKQIQNMTQILQRNNNILKTKNASDIVDFNSKQDEFRGIDTRIEFKKPILKATTFKGEKLSISVGQIEATLTFLQWSRPSTDASDRANQRVKFRSIQQMVHMDRLRGDEFMFPFQERRIYDSPSPPSEFGFPIDDSLYTSD